MPISGSDVSGWVLVESLVAGCPCFTPHQNNRNYNCIEDYPNTFVPCFKIDEIINFPADWYVVITSKILYLAWRLSSYFIFVLVKSP